MSPRPIHRIPGLALGLNFWKVTEYRPRAAIFDVVPSEHQTLHAQLQYIPTMSRCQHAARPIALCLRPQRPPQIAAPSIPTATARFFSHSASYRDTEPATTSPSPSALDAQASADLVHAGSSIPFSRDAAAYTARLERREMKARWMDPNTTIMAWAEKKLLKRGINPVGSRRRRAAVSQTLNIPFEQLPYHCFQEARQLLAEDRAEKKDAIMKAYQRLNNVIAMPVETYRGRAAYKEKVVASLRARLEYLKVQADMNDPAVKRRFEDGFGMLHTPTSLFDARDY